MGKRIYKNWFKNLGKDQKSLINSLYSEHKNRSGKSHKKKRNSNHDKYKKYDNDEIYRNMIHIRGWDFYLEDKS